MVPAIDNPNLTIIIPTLNESGTIGPLIESITETLGPTPPRIIIIDDGSTDGTIETIQGLQLKHDGITLIERGEKLGFGTALRDGFKAALDQTPEPDLIITMDADLSHDPSHLPALIQTCDRQSLVIGSRYTPGGEIHGWGPYRKTVSWGANFLARVFTNIPARDCTSGYRCYGVDIVQAVLPHLESSGYDIQIEILAEATRLDYEIKEISIKFQDRTSGESKLTSGQFVEFAKRIYTLFKKSKEGNRIIKFSIVGLSGAFITAGLLWLLTEYFNIFYIFSAVLSTEVAIINNFTWNEVWTFKDRAHGSWRDSLRRFSKFNLGRILGMIISVGLLTLLTEIFGIHYLISNLSAVIIVFVINYLISGAYIW